MGLSSGALVRRVAVTGLGIVSPLGNNSSEVLDSLRVGRSGIEFRETYRDKGMRSHVAGVVNINPAEHIDRKHYRFMADTASYAYIAMQEAIADAGLTPEEIQHPNIGVVAGSGGGSTSTQIDAVDTLEKHGIRRVSPFLTTRFMSSTVSANLCTAFGIQGVNYSITSACSTSAHCIGHAAELIQFGKQDIVFAGGAEEEHWSFVMFFDAMRATSTAFNDTPETASRPYDAKRDGLVIAAGGGMLVLEEMERAKKRGAHIYGELVGYAANSDGDNMVAPSGEGAVRCMRLALNSIQAPIDYINTHGTSTPAGDIIELKAIRETFGTALPKISSTKSMSGHALGATGAHEAIYSLLMMENAFIAPSINIETLDEEAEDFPIIRQTQDAKLTRVMSNSFGFGGTNATLVFQKV